MEYVRNLEDEYNELKQHFDERENMTAISKLKELQKGFDTLNKKFMLSKYSEYIDEYHEDELNAAYKFVNMKKQLKEQQNRTKEQNKTISELIYKLNKKQ